MKTSLPLLSSVTFAVLLAACADSTTLVPTDETASRAAPNDSPATAAALDGELDIVATAVEAGSFSTLAAALEATGLDVVLADPDATYTVFAPTDEAFAKLGDETIAALLNDTEALADILLYHVVPDIAVDAATALSLAGTSVTTVGGDDVAISRDGDRLFVNASEVILADVVASNGIIHAIDTVLTPPVDMEEAMDAPDAPTLNIVETAAAADGFATLVATLQVTGLDAVLSDPNRTFTVFAPTDEAFAALGEETIGALLADTETLSDILLYHVVAGQAVDAAAAISLAGNDVETANGDSIALALRDGELFVNDSRVIATDIVTTNGIIHVIDAVLTPPADAPMEDAPTAGMPNDGTDPAETPDAPMDTSAEAPAESPAEAPTGTILDIAREAGFGTLVAALEATGLDSPLAHPRDFYTVFAPTDEAFAALGQETIDALLADPATLESILEYHILPGNVIPSSGLPDILGFDIQTGNGDFVQFARDDDGFLVNDARIVTPDVQAVNGVIHVIDRVLLPPVH